MDRTPTPFSVHSVERRMRDHMSRQMTYVVHTSASAEPPHLADNSWIVPREYEYRNIHRDAFHAGTPEAARRATHGDQFYTHVYKVDRSSMDPVIRGDEGLQNSYDMYGLNNPHVPAPQLFESVPLLFNDIEENLAQEQPKVQPYRNDIEDSGSLSYVIPRILVGKGVTYLGRSEQRERN